MVLTVALKYSGTFTERRAKALPEFVRYDEVSLSRGSLSRILLFLGKDNRSLYGGLRYIEVRYIEVPLTVIFVP